MTIGRAWLPRLCYRCASLVWLVRVAWVPARIPIGPPVAPYCDPVCLVCIALGRLHDPDFSHAPEAKP